jgi:hypothetical protein
MSLITKNLKIAAALALLIASQGASAQVAWPTVTKQTKPWARWWWEGSAVNQKDLSWNMQSYHDAGLGGMEITPIYGVKGHESEFIQYLSPQWVDMLKYTLHEAKRLDMGIDMANATGWPFGGPWVTDQDASKELFWKNYDVKGGEKLNDPIVFIQQPLVRADGQAPKIIDLVEPISSNKNLQLMALDQVRFEKRIPLNVLMAYDGKGQALNLTDKVGTDGKLNWTAPAGDWKLYALFQGWHGKMVERAAPGGEGYVIDHFSKPALEHYLDKFDQAFKGQDVSGIRAYFNDSYEVDDARGQSNFTPQFFSEFIKRRGYDLRDHLPALFGNDSKENNNRILCDYRETISDLLLDDFTKPWHDWAKSKGALIRNQSHGSPSNILDLYAAIDIPETEGNDILRFKFATSAAHVTGKPLASSESATWLNDHFLSSLGDVKQSIDKYFIGGVNHIFYHGISYSPKDAPWPGWLFYAETHFNQTNPFWNDFSTLNQYITNCQSFLQQGNPDNDVLVYYPLFDSFSEPGERGLLKHYDAMKPDFQGTGFELSTEEMLKKGYTFDFISDKQILGLKTESGNIITGEHKYKTILLPDCKYIPLSTFNKLMGMAKAGATIVVYKNLPSEVPGYANLNDRKTQFKELLGDLNFVTKENDVKIAKAGKGQFLIANEISFLLNNAGINRESMTDDGLQFVRRTYKNGNSYFIANHGDKAVNNWVNLSVNAASVVIFDPMTKKYGLAKSKKLGKDQTAVYLQLQPGESCILQTFPLKTSVANYAYYQPAGKQVAINGTWALNFTQGGPTLPKPLKLNELKSWTVLDGDEFKAFSGTGSYTISFKKPAQNAVFWQLDLGKVHENAEVYLNGKKLATLIGPQYTVTIPSAQLKTVNELQIKVVNLMVNRIIDMDKKNIPYRIFYNTNFQSHSPGSKGKDGLFTAINWEPKPSGLLGPVVLTPLRYLGVK